MQHTLIFSGLKFKIEFILKLFVFNIIIKNVSLFLGPPNVIILWQYVLLSPHFTLTRLLCLPHHCKASSTSYVFRVEMEEKTVATAVDALGGPGATVSPKREGCWGISIINLKKFSGTITCWFQVKKRESDMQNLEEHKSVSMLMLNRFFH